MVRTSQLVSGIVAKRSFGGVINASYTMNSTIHNTGWVPAHFHLIYGGTTVIMYFAAAYWA